MKFRIYANAMDPIIENLDNTDTPAACGITEFLDYEEYTEVFDLYRKIYDVPENRDISLILWEIDLTNTSDYNEKVMDTLRWRNHVIFIVE